MQNSNYAKKVPQFSFVFDGIEKAFDTFEAPKNFSEKIMRRSQMRFIKKTYARITKEKAAYFPMVALAILPSVKDVFEEYANLLNQSPDSALEILDEIGDKLSNDTILKENTRIVISTIQKMTKIFDFAFEFIDTDRGMRIINFKEREAILTALEAKIISLSEQLNISKTFKVEDYNINILELTNHREKFLELIINKLIHIENSYPEKYQQVSKELEGKLIISCISNAYGRYTIYFDLDSKRNLLEEYNFNTQSTTLT